MWVKFYINININRLWKWNFKVSNVKTLYSLMQEMGSIKFFIQLLMMGLK